MRWLSLTAWVRALEAAMIAGSISGRTGRNKLVWAPWVRHVILLTSGMLCLQGSQAATLMARAAARPAAAAALWPWALLIVARPRSPGTLPRSWEASGSQPQVSGLALVSLPGKGPLEELVRSWCFLLLFLYSLFLLLGWPSIFAFTLYFV